jgi:hypothetical protein
MLKRLLELRDGHKDEVDPVLEDRAVGLDGDSADECLC